MRRRKKPCPTSSAVALVVALALAGCGGGEPRAGDGDGVGNGSADGSVTGNGIRVTLASLADDNFGALEKCVVGVTVANGTGEDLRNVAVEYLPRGSDTDEMIAHAGGEMLIYAKDIDARSTGAADSQIRGMACAGLTGIEVTAVRCQTGDRKPCADAVTVDSSLDGVAVARREDTAGEATAAE